MTVQMQVAIQADCKGLKQAEGRAKHLRPLLAVWGQIARTSAIRNFESGGRPTRWLPSIRARKHGGLTLVFSGRLRQSISARVSDSYVTVGTNVVYARIHQLGGVVETGPRSRVLAFSGGKFMSRSAARRRRKGAIQVRFARSGGAYIPIPARPFLLVQTEDLAEMRRAAVGYLAGATS